MTWNRGWITTLAGTGINLTLGILYAWSVFKGPVKEALHITEFQASLPYAVAIGVFALMMVPAGRLQDRLGPKVIVTIGGILASLGLAFSYFASSITILVVTFGLLAGTGFALGYAATTPAAVKWFPPAMKGIIIGVVVSGFGLAPVYISPTVKALLAAYGVQTSFLILGVAFLVVNMVLARLVNNPEAGYAVPGAVAAVKAAPKGRDYEWSEMVRTPQFYLLWIMYAAGAMGGLMVTGHLASYAKSIGLESGFFLVALLAVFNAAGRIGGGIVSDRLGRIRTMLIVFVLHAATLLATPYASGLLFLSVCTALMGLCYGSYMSIFPSTTYEYFGTKNGGVNYGLLFTAWGIGGVFGAPLAGYMKDVTGSYTLAFQIAAGLIVVAAAVTFLTRAPQGAAVSAGAPVRKAG